jgi:excisionase family DNA binding protein
MEAKPTNERTVAVAWIAKRWNVSRETVLRLLHSGTLRGYRITTRGWWQVVEASVYEHERNIRNEHGAGPR